MISTFAEISSATGTNSHPEPAASFASFLGATNFDFIKLVPLECFTQTDFYSKLCVKTLVPIVLLLLLWTWPFSLFIMRKPYMDAVRKAAGLTLMGLEVCLLCSYLAQ